MHALFFPHFLCCSGMTVADFNSYSKVSKSLVEDSIASYRMGMTAYVCLAYGRIGRKDRKKRL